jgi:hypothetical protein
MFTLWLKEAVLINQEPKYYDYAYYLGGETFVDGQGKDVWCNSKVQITNMDMIDKPSFNVTGVPTTTYIYQSTYNNITSILRLITGLRVNPAYSLYYGYYHFICQE